MKEITVILHVSDSTWGNAVAIDEWHRNRPQPFRMIGYQRVFLNGVMAHGQSYVKRLDGVIETGRPYGVRGAHTRGANHHAGWCLVGRSGEWTKKQIKAVKKEIKALLEEDGYDVVRVKQHSDYDPVNKPFCAGFSDKQMEEFNVIGRGYGKYITRRQ